MRGPSSIDLSGTASFAARGLTGTVRSTIALHLSRLKGRPSPVLPPPGNDPVVAVRYRVARMAGSLSVNWTSTPGGCAATNSCGFSGGFTDHFGHARGRADIVAYDADFGGLRRGLGLAPGRAPFGTQVSGTVMWRSADGAVSATVERDGAQVCSDTAPLRAGFIGVDISGKRARFVVGDFTPTLAFPSGRGLFQSRCENPALVAFNKPLVSAPIPLRLLGRRAITLHITTGGATGHGAGFLWHAHPDLTIVLQRTRIDQLLVDSSIFET
jgi:hypothetical protein